MLKQSARHLADRAIQFGLVDHDQLNGLWEKLGTPTPTVDEFCRHAFSCGLLTNYQISRLRSDKKQGFIYDGYNVLDMVGEGAFARIFRAKKMDTGEIAALKIMRSRYCKDRKQVDRFVAEGQLGMDLHHANIVPIHDVLSRSETHFLRMEHVEGYNLEQFLKKYQRCSLLEAVSFIADVARGLSYAFQKGVTHRDVRMSNIMVTPEGDARLIDFGLAGDHMFNDPSTNPRTVEYGSLEKVTEVARGDMRSDIYFCGCVLYQLLTGKRPLGVARTHGQMMRASRFRNVVQLRYLDPSIPPSIADVVDRAMQLDILKRYQTPMEFLAALEESAACSNHDLLSTPEDYAKSHSQGFAPSDQDLDSPRKSILVIGIDPGILSMLKNKLRRRGNRVLVSSKPNAAVGRIKKEPGMVDGVIFSSVGMGNLTVAAFNHCATVAEVKEVPAFLLLGPQHKVLRVQADLAEHRIAVQSPISLNSFMDQVEELVPATVADGGGIEPSFKNG
ncbi:MAG: serine/threonine protein kinase [Planctomycetales bacterium]